MARLVILEFEDNIDAEDFAASVHYPVVGIFALPTTFCEGSPTTGCMKHQGKLGWYWTRGDSFGWWICRVCHKPAKPKSHENLVRNTVSEGVNLLVGNNDEQQDVFDAGWGAYRNAEVLDQWRRSEE